MSQTILFPTMAQPFFETSDLILNGDLELNGKNGDLNNGPDDPIPETTVSVQQTSSISMVPTVTGHT